ncbi:hypothetical protein E2C01_040819 [Portunus trituberculatus]|uniref:Uncharacterized protein n=1 Tax=Portunus trituberculatus TaxID=210409 RepID=A0A5B7FNL8_PORTR|nr:hypothetical protein [Portunus trituberculatus]
MSTIVVASPLAAVGKREGESSSASFIWVTEAWSCRVSVETPFILHQESSLGSGKWEEVGEAPRSASQTRRTTSLPPEYVTSISTFMPVKNRQHLPRLHLVETQVIEEAGVDGEGETPTIFRLYTAPFS